MFPLDLQFFFADSEVASMALENAVLRVRFSAAHVTRPEASSWGGRQRGYLDAVELECAAPARTALPEVIRGRLADGRMQVGGAWKTGWPLPSRLDEPVTLELQFAQGSSLQLVAPWLAFRVLPGASWVDALAC